MDAMKRLCAHALAQGARRVSAMRIAWDISGDCQKPYTREIFARPSGEKPRKDRVMASLVKTMENIAKLHEWQLPTGPVDIAPEPIQAPPSIVVGRWSEHPLELILETRCRRCDRCRRTRQVLWTYRAKTETARAVRTWFGTITLAPEHHHAVTLLCRRDLARQGVDFDSLAFGEQFILRHSKVSEELTKYIKRVRKQCGGPLRYLLVAEQHKSMLPHYHMLVHEQSMLSPVTHRVLTAQWRLGFTKWKLVIDPKQATYLCKYLSKSAAARVRGSQRYGQ